MKLFYVELLLEREHWYVRANSAKEIRTALDNKGVQEIDYNIEEVVSYALKTFRSKISNRPKSAWGRPETRTNS